MKNKLITLIIPAKNAEETITAAINSVEALASLTPTQLIIVEDGSTDNTLEIICAAISQTKSLASIVLSNPQSIGPGPSRNRALALAEGSSIGFIDSDDILIPESYCAVLSQAQHEKRDMALFDDVNGVYDRQRITKILDKTERSRLLRRLEIDGSVIYSLFSSKLIFDNNLSFGEHYFEDFQFQYGAVAAAKNILISSKTCYAKSDTAESILNTFSTRHVAGVHSLFEWLNEVMPSFADDDTDINVIRADIAYGIRGLMYNVINQGQPQNESVVVDRLKEFVTSEFDLELVMKSLTRSSKDQHLKRLFERMNYEIL